MSHQRGLDCSAVRRDCPRCFTSVASSRIDHIDVQPDPRSKNPLQALNTFSPKWRGCGPQRVGSISRGDLAARANANPRSSLTPPWMRFSAPWPSSTMVVRGAKQESGARQYEIDFNRRKESFSLNDSGRDSMASPLSAQEFAGNATFRIELRLKKDANSWSVAASRRPHP